MKKLGVIILNWNGRGLLEKFIPAASKFTISDQADLNYWEYALYRSKKITGLRKDTTAPLSLRNMNMSLCSIQMLK